MKIFSAPPSLLAVLVAAPAGPPTHPSFHLLVFNPTRASAARSLACSSSLVTRRFPSRAHSRTPSSLDQHHHLLLSIPAPFRLPSFLSNQ